MKRISTEDLDKLKSLDGCPISYLVQDVPQTPVGDGHQRIGCGLSYQVYHIYSLSLIKYGMKLVKKQHTNQT